MRIFDVDVSKKNIDFELNGKRYQICFRDSLRKGVHDVSVWVNGKKTNATILGTYPPLGEVIKELRQMHLPLWKKRKINKRIINLEKRVTDLEKKIQDQPQKTIDGLKHSAKKLLP